MSETPKLYRVILQVSDLDQAAEFYSKLLDTDGRRIHGGFRHYFDCGDVILALVDPAADDETARPNPDNIYFSVADIADVHRRAAGLGCLSTGDVHGEAAGEIITRPWGERSFYAIDPFGNPICFVEESTIFTGR